MYHKGQGLIFILILHFMYSTEKGELCVSEREAGMYYVDRWKVLTILTKGDVTGPRWRFGP